LTLAEADRVLCSNSVELGYPIVDYQRCIVEALNVLRREINAPADIEDGDLITIHVGRVEVRPKQLMLELKAQAGDQDEDGSAEPKVIEIPWTKPPSKRRREIIVSDSASKEDTRPIRADARVRLVVAIAQGRRWLDKLVTGAVPDIEAIATRERCSARKVNMTVSLAFLAPDLVKAAIEGRLPRGIGIARLCDPPIEWPSQYRKLGLTRS